MRRPLPRFWEERDGESACNFSLGLRRFGDVRGGPRRHRSSFFPAATPVMAARDSRYPTARLSNEPGKLRSSMDNLCCVADRPLHVLRSLHPAASVYACRHPRGRAGRGVCSAMRNTASSSSSHACRRRPGRTRMGRVRIAGFADRGRQPAVAARELDRELHLRRA